MSLDLSAGIPFLFENLRAASPAPKSEWRRAPSIPSTSATLIRGRFLAHVAPVQHYFSGLTGHHRLKALFVLLIAETMRNDRRNIYTGFQHHRHLVPRLIHLAAIDTLDRDHVEDHFAPVHLHRLRRNPQHCNLA